MKTQKIKLLITYNISNDLLSKIPADKFLIVKRIEKYPFKESDLAHLLKDKDAILSTLTDKLNAKVLARAKNLKVISQCSAGLDNIALEYAKQKGIKVYNTPAVLSKAVAELTVALIFACLRNIVEAHFFTREGKFTGWKVDLFLGELLEGKVVGIVGCGKIGQEVARKLSLLGANILYYSKTPKKELEEKFNCRFVDIDTLLSQSDIVTVHLPLTEETRNFLNADKLLKLKERAIFINTSRGEIVDEETLIKLLKSNRIKIAGLDVYKNEPYINKKLMRLKNVILLPHIGSAVTSVRYAMMKQAVDNLITHFASSN